MSRTLDKPINIGFHFLGPGEWHGGIIHLETLIRAVRRRYGDAIRWTYLVGYGKQKLEQAAQLADRTLIYPRFPRWSRERLLGSAAWRFFRYERSLDRWLRANGIQVVAFGGAPQGSRLPSVAFVPDFQHRHFPDFFTREDWQQRERGIARTCEAATLVLLLSRAAFTDLSTFVNEYAHKGRILSPVPWVEASALQASPAAVTRAYNLPNRFFHLPNQFWRHKNHQIVITALETLKARGIEPFVVFTGHPGDLRDPTYFSEILSRISKAGVRNQVALIGLVPYQEVLALMRQSIAVLNPSQFEGFGMAIAEARIFGKPVIVSNIPAHKEQDHPDARYFDPTCADDLAVHLAEVWETGTPGPNPAAEAQGLAKLEREQEDYADRFVDIVLESMAVESHPASK